METQLFLDIDFDLVILANLFIIVILLYRVLDFLHRPSFPIFIVCSYYVISGIMLKRGSKIMYLDHRGK